MAVNPRHIAIFVRPPAPGRVKTRLAGVLGEEHAAALYRAFVLDTIEVVAGVDHVDVTLWCSATPSDEVHQWARRLGADLQLQPEGDLGDRLRFAFARHLEDTNQVVVLGSDAPTLGPEYVEAMFANLRDADLALGPTADGGYFAIGARSNAPNLDGVRWSTRSTLKDTVASNPHRKVALTAPWYDVDTPADLYLLHAHLSLISDLAPHTRAALRQIGQPFTRVGFDAGRSVTLR